MLEKVITYDGQFLEDGQIQVRRITRIMEDGVQLSKSYHRHVVDVGDDLTGQPEIVRNVAAGLHTPARVAARRAFKAKQNREEGI
jgi:hypothetical protein